MAPPNIQIFGTRKCPETRKAERWFKERGLRPHFIDLAERGPSPGELKSIAARVGGFEPLLDRAGSRYRDRGLLQAAPTGPRIEAALVADPLLLKTPIVRCSKEATVGFQPEIWATWR